jgi:hypothetical protein
MTATPIADVALRDRDVVHVHVHGAARDHHGCSWNDDVCLREPPQADVADVSSGCARAQRIEPLPQPRRVRVTFPLGDGTAHEITDPVVLSRLETLMNVDCTNWRDIGSFGKYPMARADLQVEADGPQLWVAIGDSWLQRGNLLKNIPEAREAELLRLVGAESARFSKP